jgi:hypothetical protein
MSPTRRFNRSGFGRGLPLTSTRRLLPTYLGNVPPHPVARAPCHVCFHWTIVSWALTSRSTPSLFLPSSLPVRRRIASSLYSLLRPCGPLVARPPKRRPSTRLTRPAGALIHEDADVECRVVNRGTKRDPWRNERAAGRSRRVASGQVAAIGQVEHPTNARAQAASCPSSSLDSQRKHPHRRGEVIDGVGCRYGVRPTGGRGAASSADADKEPLRRFGCVVKSLDVTNIRIYRPSPYCVPTVCVPYGSIAKELVRNRRWLLGHRH